MTTLAKKYDPVLPSEQDSKVARVSSRLLAKRLKDPDGLKVRLDDETEVLLPPSALRMMVDILAQMAEGNAITIIPFHAEMTTQQAADFLNVSRPFFVREVLEMGKVPFRKLGSHRRIQFQELLRYKQEQEQKSLKAFQELTEQAQELEMGY